MPSARFTPHLRVVLPFGQVPTGHALPSGALYTREAKLPHPALVSLPTCGSLTASPLCALRTRFPPVPHKGKKPLVDSPCHGLPGKQLRSHISTGKQPPKRLLPLAEGAAPKGLRVAPQAPIFIPTQPRTHLPPSGARNAGVGRKRDRPKGGRDPTHAEDGPTRKRRG